MLASVVSADVDLEPQQARLNVVRDVFSSRKFPSMIAALKQAIAIYGKRSGMGQGAAAAGRTHDCAGEIARSRIKGGRLRDERNGARGARDIEGKVTRVGASETGAEVSIRRD